MLRGAKGPGHYESPNTTFLSTLAFAQNTTFDTLRHAGSEASSVEATRKKSTEPRDILPEAETLPKSQCLLHAALKLGHASPHWQ